MKKILLGASPRMDLTKRNPNSIEAPIRTLNTLAQKKKLFGYFLSFFVGYMQENMYRQFSLYVLLIVVTLKILYKAPFGNILQIILSCLLYNCNFLGYNYICDDPTFGLGQDLRIIWFDSFFLFILILRLNI